MIIILIFLVICFSQRHVISQQRDQAAQVRAKTPPPMRLRCPRCRSITTRYPYMKGAMTLQCRGCPAVLRVPINR